MGSCAKSRPCIGLVFDVLSEATALVRTHQFAVVEANLAASGRSDLVPGAEFSLISPPANAAHYFETMLERVREQGRAPGIALISAAPRRPGACAPRWPQR